MDTSDQRPAIETAQPVYTAEMVANTVHPIVQQLLEKRHIPRATYRIQFNEQFTFQDAVRLVPYLRDLGISDLYASPIFKSRSGSTHGYDICDYSQFSPVLGTAEDFDTLSRTLHDAGMGIILDTVPNHMGIGDPCNVWWMDVLENGPSSAYADFFDIDWEPIKPELENKILLPILEDQYGKVLEDGKFRLNYEDGAFFITYYENKLPVTPRTYGGILSYPLEALIEQLGAESEPVQELQSILTALNYLPPRTEQDPGKLAERQREKEVIKRRITALIDSSPAIRRALTETILTFNGTVGDPHSFDRLDDLIERQSYRPAFWRVAGEEINYRRFFDINDLAAICVELPPVFQATHQLIFELLAAGKVNGLRIDHSDGLWNPADYFFRLQERFVTDNVRAYLAEQAASREIPEADIQTIVNAVIAEFREQKGWPLYVVAEKILSDREPLPQDWTVYGTTGYDFMNTVNGLFIDSSNRKAFDGIYSRFIKDRPNFRALVASSKKMVMETSLASEINTLGHDLERINEKNRRYRDFTLNAGIDALRELITALPVYRTYITRPGEVSPRDKEFLGKAISEARRRNPQIPRSLFHFIHDTLLLANIDEFRESDRQSLIDFVMKFQQVTGPVMAKSVEDTTFYIYNRLVSLNEVGGDPELFGVSVAEFNRRNVERVRRWPHALLASSTHDTKRSEDVRARISVLSEMPAEWSAGLARWRRLNSRHRTMLEGVAAPDANTEYLFYQTLLGTWPLALYTPDDFARFRERIADYMLKAAKEAKVHTSWINPVPEYDEALRQFVYACLDEKTGKRFLEDFQAFQHRLAYFGLFNSLSQQLLKLTSPGVPDIYQGTELWDWSLVDPDNRRPIDYSSRMQLLAGLGVAGSPNNGGTPQNQMADELLEHIDDGRIKLYVTQRTLSYRREQPQIFMEGDYVPLEAAGDKASHVCAFRRAAASGSILVVTPRLIMGLVGGLDRPPIGEEVWGNTWLSLPNEPPGSRYRNLFTGELIEVMERNNTAGLPLGMVLGRFPVALLVTAH